MKARVIFGWSPSIKRLSLIRSLHEQVGYSLAKSEYLVDRLDKGRNCYVQIVCEDEEAAQELAQLMRAVGAACEVTAG